MSSSPIIHFLGHKEIDKARWNECIYQSVSPLIYGKTFYLDCIAPGWNGLVGDNYDWVMPLTSRRKYGISYLYQPAFTQQLGSFAKPGIIVPIKEIIDNLQSRYRFCEINWNYAAPPLLSSLPVTIQAATNFILDLSPAYNRISGEYDSSLKKSLKKATTYQQYYISSEDFHGSIGLYKKYYGKRVPHVTNDDYVAFGNICSYASKTGCLVCRSVIDTHGSILASILLLLDANRLYNIMDTTTETGRLTLANHFLFDQLIREFAGQNMLLDFEGSDLPGVKAFYSRFGPIDQGYFGCRYNCLPWPLNILKT